MLKVDIYINNSKVFSMSQLKENDDYNFNFNQKQNIVEAIIFSSSETFNSLFDSFSCA